MTTSRAVRHPALVLLSLALAQLIIALDYSIVFVALPDIGAGIGFSSHELQWVIGAYAVTFGGFLLLGGRLSDLLGRRRLFFVGLALYAISSVAGGLAESPELLVLARAVQGLGGAVLGPSTLSLITTMFAEGKERNRALGVWGATGSSGMVVGSLLGGVLTQTMGWEAVFFVNVPLAVGVGLLALLVVPPDTVTARRGGLDLPGGVTVTAGALLLVFGLVNGPEAGWTDVLTLGSFVGAALFVAAFVLIESRSTDPLVPLRVFRNRNLRFGTLITFSFMATFGASAYFITLALQEVRGWNALNTGLAYILPCALILIGSLLGGKLSTAIGVRSALVLGLVVGAIGTALFAAFLDSGSTFLQMTPGIVVFSLAQGVLWTSMFAAATSGVENELQGLASGLATSGQQVGAAVGLAVLVGVTSTVSGPDPSPDRLSTGLQVAEYTSAVLILLSVVFALALPRAKSTAAAEGTAGKAPVEKA
ncbi:MFS transporter [Saccharothrix obliqua]|uniref:MFS transporter n=1 Tax=Saccharothrix obliqua TaxID=2861747 RepID=UPI001C604F1C|nr:MFS transporter [Saccharothrix obliqua]MBW4721599.1 MFS transporter [Saccharothrix obliqua]